MPVVWGKRAVAASCAWSPREARKAAIWGRSIHHDDELNSGKKKEQVQEQENYSGLVLEASFDANSESALVEETPALIALSAALFRSFIWL